jgi:hypothetical protein
VSFDFSKVSRPTTTGTVLDPIEIFRKTPNLAETLPELWAGQKQALTDWHNNYRSTEDVIISLNTGAGKTIVGVLIAQSLVNENIGGVVFACATIDLVEQTARECDRLGIRYSKRVSSEYSNDLYQTGKSFCLTTYQSLFLKRGPFTSTPPSAVIFDDAHVAERMIRDAFTLRVEKRTFAPLFEQLIQIVRPEFDRIGKLPHLDATLSLAGASSVTMCPPATAYRCREQIIGALKAADFSKHSDLLYPTLHLYEHVHFCSIIVSPHAIEITPPFLPVGSIPFMRKGTRRVYLSATLDFQTDFTRAFGKANVPRIEPSTDAGDGERLILLSSRLHASADKMSMSRKVLETDKLLISVPSYRSASSWSPIAVPPPANEFSRQLNEFRRAANGAFVLVSRIDGIDLPRDTCRVMLMDGMPSGSNLLEVFLFQKLNLSTMYSTKMAARIAQLFGRINRGRSDYGAYLIYGSDFNVWLKTDRNIALLPQLIRKQLLLGQQLQDSFGELTVDAAVALIRQVLGRDKEWLKLYRETVDGLEVSQDVLDRVRERERVLAVSAEAECDFISRLWEDDIDGARAILIDSINNTAVSDARLAGWHAVWLGMTYEIHDDYNNASTHYRRARSRLSSGLTVPLRFSAGTVVPETSGPVHDALAAADRAGAQAVGGLAAKLKAKARVVADPAASTNQQEEALREFGELIGLDGQRPDDEHGTGPDVIWIDDTTKALVAFELKTKKDNPATYTKTEVGQAHNHDQWISDNFPDHRCDGILIIGPPGRLKTDASPSARLFHVTTDALVGRLNEFAAKIDDARARLAIDRTAILIALGALPEWQAIGWHASLATASMASMPRTE